MSSNEFNRDLLKMVSDILGKYESIESMEAEKEQDIKDNFLMLWDIYKTVSKSRNKQEIDFVIVKIRMRLYAMLVKILSAFNRSDTYDQMMIIHGNISDAIKELKKEKEFLNTIKDVIKELEIHKNTDKNYNISLLLLLIYDKNCLIYDVLKEEIESLQIRMKGIDYASNTGKRKELENTNISIENKAKELKLIKKS